MTKVIKLVGNQVIYETYFIMDSLFAVMLRVRGDSDWKLFLFSLWVESGSFECMILRPFDQFS